MSGGNEAVSLSVMKFAYFYSSKCLYVTPYSAMSLMKTWLAKVLQSGITLMIYTEPWPLLMLYKYKYQIQIYEYKYTVTLQSSWMDGQCNKYTLFHTLYFTPYLANMPIHVCTYSQVFVHCTRLWLFTQFCDFLLLPTMLFA